MERDDRTARQDSRATYGHGETDSEEHVSSTLGGVAYQRSFPAQVPPNHPYATTLSELESSEASESTTEQDERGHRARHDHDQYYADASGSA
jgi:hypothetical protein